MKDDSNNKKYILTIEFNPDTEEVESVQEEVVDPEPSPLLFKGNVWILDYIDDEHIAKINVFEIGES